MSLAITVADRNDLLTTSSRVRHEAA